VKKKDAEFWLLVCTWAPMCLWLMVLPYVFLPLLLALLLTGIVLAVAGATFRVRGRIARRRQAHAQLERARWALMTNLTEADERWLAERHFWIVPLEVARLRAGVDPEEGSYFLCKAELDQRKDMQARSEASRAAFEGIRRTQEFVEPESAAGQLVSASR
jgi:hypothetical protein